MKVSNTGTHCDFCAIGDPHTMYDLPRDFVLIATVEVTTGQAQVTKSASGLICACEICARIIAGALVVDRLTRRIFRVNPTVNTLRGGAKKIAKAAGKKIWTRWLRNMSNPHFFVDGEDPFQGLRVDYQVGEDRSEPEKN